MFDTHCHLDAEEYEPDLDEVLRRARERGVSRIFVPGYEPSEWRQLRVFCARDQSLSFGVGIHPWYVAGLDEAARKRSLSDLASIARDEGACAIGECGLDAVHAKRGGADLTLQRVVLEAHIEVARRLKLPLVLHCVRAHGTMLELLERDGPLEAGGVMHSFGGAAELVPRYVKLGLYFSFAGAITREVHKKPRQTAAIVPVERLLVESDGPDQVAAPLARTRSEPADITYVLDALADLRKEARETLAQHTNANAIRLFDAGRA